MNPEVSYSPDVTLVAEEPTGLDAEVFRKLHRQRGKKYAWWKAFRCDCANPITGEADPGCALCERNGRQYIPQFVHPSFRALFDEAKEEWSDEEFGRFAVGATKISVMPDESFLARYDRIVQLEGRLVARETLKRGAGDRETVARRFVPQFIGVRQGATIYRRDIDYLLSLPYDQHPQIVWLDEGDKPAPGAAYIAEYLYQPSFLFVGASKPPRPGKNGILLPLRGYLKEEQPE